MARFIPVYSPAADPEDAARVAEAVSAGHLSAMAPPVPAFERAWAARCRMPHGVAVSSGTAALEVAMLALGIGPGDEVVCPALTIISCARAIVLAGAVPVLVDVDPSTWCLDPAEVEARVGRRTRAILGVHAFGRPYDHAAIDAIARRHRLLVIEDAAQAHGATVQAGADALPCGGLGDTSAFSFFANKALTTGEGGMLLARDGAVADRARQVSNLFFRGPRRFLHEELGHNYRLSAVQAALGLSQLDRLDETLATKRRIAKIYREQLESLAEVELQDVTEGSTHWMNALVLDHRTPADAAALSDALARRGIETRPFFLGLHEQPALRARGLFAGERFPVTERLSRRGLYLPSGLDLNESTIVHVVEQLRGALVELGPARASVPPGPAPPSESHEVPSSVEGTATGPVFGDVYAEAYDALYADKDYAREALFLQSCFERFGMGAVRRVLDLGCGTGRHAGELSRLGYGVVGVDRSSAMLHIARRRAPDLRFVEGDLCSVALDETFDAVVVLFAALGYQTTADAILAALGTARRHLRAEGLLVADVWLGGSDARGDAPTRRVARQGDIEWIRTGRFQRDPLEQRVEVSYELRRRSNAGESVSREMHSMHYFSPFELDFALRASGFQLLCLCRDGDLDHAPAAADRVAYFVARAATRPGEGLHGLGLG
jgi:perosamine synthetase